MGLGDAISGWRAVWAQAGLEKMSSMDEAKGTWIVATGDNTRALD